MRLRRVLLFGSLSVLAGLLLASCAASAERPAASRTPSEPASQPSSPSTAAVTHSRTVTAHHTFAPYDASGELTATVGDSARTGTCWTTSIAVPVAGVYRCIAANEILDPCFAPATETNPPTLACFVDPWHPGTVLTLHESLPKDEPIAGDGHPWALQLVNGAHCVAFTGMVPTVAGVAVQYACGDGAVAGLGTNASGPLIAHYGSIQGPLHTEQVVAEWRGRSYRVDPAD